MSDATDADVLLAYMCERKADDAPAGSYSGAFKRLNGGTFAHNLNVAAAEIGWAPERLSAAMQELCARELVLPDHPSGDPKKIANSRWLVVDPFAVGEADAESDAGDGDTPVEEMKVAELRAYAEQHEIDLGEATKKDEIRDAILNAEAEVRHE